MYNVYRWVYAWMFADESLIDDRLCQRKRPYGAVVSDCRSRVETARISEGSSHISVDSQYNYRTLAQLLILAV